MNNYIMIIDIFRNLYASLIEDVIYEIKNAVKKNKELIILKRPVQLPLERNDITKLIPSVKKSRIR